MKAEQGVILRDNVHGIDVFLDDPAIRICDFSATATIHTPPNPFFPTLTSCWRAAVMLEQLAAAAREAKIGTNKEREEVAEAIKNGLHRLSLRQGVFRLLASLSLSDLRKRWDALYAERSTLVHGLAPKPGADYNDLAFRTVTLCGHILLRAVEPQIPGASQHISTYYALQDP